MEIILVQCCIEGSDIHVQVTAGVKAMRQRPYVVSTILSGLIGKAERSMEMQVSLSTILCVTRNRKLYSFCPLYVHMTIYKFKRYICFPYKKEETMFHTVSSVTQHCPKCSCPILALSFSSYRKSISLVQRLYNYLQSV